MSILIKREMPKGCWACPFAVGKHYECLFTKKSYNWGLTTRPSDCPLVEVPTPHGRLIDASTRVTVGTQRGIGLRVVTVDRLIDEYAVRNVPTIIEAERSENENNNV